MNIYCHLLLQGHYSCLYSAQFCHQSVHDCHLQTVQRQKLISRDERDRLSRVPLRSLLDGGEDRLELVVDLLTVQSGDESLQHLQPPCDLGHLDTLSCRHPLQVSSQTLSDSEEALDDTEAGPVEEYLDKQLVRTSSSPTSRR